VIAELHRTLDQELVAILRGASLECPVCGEFLLHRADGIGCPQCGLEFGGGAAGGWLELGGEAVAGELLTDAPVRH
jgi:predicted RNA-binding Zn-ribbon protein involved in translation (DUF1610 family)